MLRSLYNGVSGIKTQSSGMDVWSNNISNINNAGFKANLPEFKSILYQSAVTAGNWTTTDQVGLGATLQTTAIDMSDGAYQATDNRFDMAIHGDGFFAVKTLYGATQYTRTGSFDIDAAGNLVDNSGNFVQGTMNTLVSATPSAQAIKEFGQSDSGAIDAYTITNMNAISLAGENAQTNIKLPKFLYQAAEPTTRVNIQGNLNSSKITKSVDTELPNPSYTSTIDAANKTISLSGNITGTPGLTNYKKGDLVVVRVQDGDGKFVDISAQVDENGGWQIDNYATTYMDQATITTSAKVTTNQETPNTQKMTTEIFAADGTKNYITINFTKQIPQANDATTWDAVATLTDAGGNVLDTKNGTLVFGPNARLISTTLNSVGAVALNFGGDGDPLVYSGLRSAANTAEMNTTKNGFAEGILKSYDVDNNGNIIATMTNSNMFSVAKVALYHFQNDQGLERVGDNNFVKTSNSGEPFFYRNDLGEVIYGSKITSNFLEMSNVDLGQALTEVIVIQKAYEASSKSITTSDEMLQTAIQMKK